MDIQSDKVECVFLNASAGPISESDVLLASSSDAVILGFNVKVEANAVKLLKREGVQVKLYSIVYELIDQVRDAMLGLLEPETRETIIGHAKVLQVFKLNKGRAAGCMVEDGKILRSCEARVIRDKTPVFDGKMSTLRRFQDEVEEVKAGLECGIRLGDFNEYEAGDIIECYTLEKSSKRCNPKQESYNRDGRPFHAPPGVQRSSIPVPFSPILPSPIEPIGPSITLSLHMSRRTDKVNELLRREIGTTIQRDFEFPGTIVTVIEVEVTDDLKEGKVWVGVVGKMSPAQVLEKLNSRHGLIQSAVAKRVVLRNTPRLSFRLDDSAQRGVDLVNLLEDIDKNLPKAPPADPENGEE